MTNANDNEDKNPKQGSETPDHQREDQPLKELNDDPAAKEKGTDGAGKIGAPL